VVAARVLAQQREPAVEPRQSGRTDVQNLDLLAHEFDPPPKDEVPELGRARVVGRANTPSGELVRQQHELLRHRKLHAYMVRHPVSGWSGSNRTLWFRTSLTLQPPESD